MGQRALESAFPRDPTRNLTHLRRFAKPDFLPDHLKGSDSVLQLETGGSRSIYILIPPPLPDRVILEALLTPYFPIPSGLSDETGQLTSRIQSTRIPLQPPTSLAQAQTWSRTFWPTIYNPAAHPASHSPPPTVLAQTQAAIESRAGKYLALARKAACEAKQSGRGRAIGAVVVDPAVAGTDGLGGVLAIAGDARYWNSQSDNSPSQPGLTQWRSDTGSETANPKSPQKISQYDAEQEGQPTHHAVMRAISMVANRRLSSSAASPQTTPAISSPPLTPLESYPSSSPASPVLLTRIRGGYLCTRLDLYVTHEPCVCCAMGMLLSRFRAVVFVERTRRREIAAFDAERGYGLHWRRELNWRTLAFEFLEQSSCSGAEGEEAEEFHA